MVLLIIGHPACPAGPPKLLGKPGALKGLLTPNSSPVEWSMKLNGSGGGAVGAGGAVAEGYWLGSGIGRYGFFLMYFNSFSLALHL
jgi:hypothetical protein